MSKDRPKCPIIFNIPFGRELVSYLGGDASKIENHWCWEDFGKAYPEFLKKAMEYFEEAEEGDPSWAMYWLVRYGKAPVEWAMEEIPKIKIGTPAWAMYCLVRHCNAPLEWAMEEMSKIKIGAPALAMYYLVRLCEAPIGWAKENMSKIDFKRYFK